MKQSSGIRTDLRLTSKALTLPLYQIRKASDYTRIRSSLIGNNWKRNNHAHKFALKNILNFTMLEYSFSMRKLIKSCQ